MNIKHAVKELKDTLFEKKKDTFKRLFKDHFKKQIILETDETDGIDLCREFTNIVFMEYKGHIILHSNEYDIKYITREKLALEAKINYIEKNKYGSYLPALISSIVPIFTFAYGEIINLGSESVKNNQSKLKLFINLVTNSSIFLILTMNEKI